MPRRIARVPAETISTIQVGTSLGDLKKTFGVSAHHMFTVSSKIGNTTAIRKNKKISVGDTLVKLKKTLINQKMEDEVQSLYAMKEIVVPIRII